MAKRTQKPNTRLRAETRTRPSGRASGRPAGRTSGRDVYRPWWKKKRVWSSYAFLAFIAIFVAWLFASGWMGDQGNRLSSKLYDETKRIGLSVQEIYITGRQQTSNDEIMAALGIERGDAILSVDLDAAHKRLMTIAWLDSVRIERHLPNIIYIDIKERKPYALWQYQQQISLIDRSGHVLTRDRTERFSSLPFLVGQGANREAQDIIELMAASPDFDSQMQAAIRVGDRRWDIRLKNGITLRLPEVAPDAALERLSEVWRTTDISARAVRTIDARQTDRLVIDEKMPDDAGEKPLDPRVSTSVSTRAATPITPDAASDNDAEPYAVPFTETNR